VALSSNTIDENVAGAVIGKLATDEDAADTHTFKVDDTRFEVDALGNLKLKAGQSLNYEARNSVVVNVTATDNGSPALSKEQAFTITVNDRNDAPEAQHDTAIELGEDTTSQALDVLANDTDEDGGPLTITNAIAASGSTVQIVTEGGKQVLLYTADASSFDALGSGGSEIDTITYTVSDGQGGLTQRPFRSPSEVQRMERTSTARSAQTF